MNNRKGAMNVSDIQSKSESKEGVIALTIRQKYDRNQLYKTSELDINCERLESFLAETR